MTQHDGAAVVVADTGPLHYLVLIGHIEMLPHLFGTVALPATVLSELRHPKAPIEIRTWAAAPPPWVAVHRDPALPASLSLSPLDPGELAAIALAEALGATLVLLDDRAGTAAARGRGLDAVGTVGLLTRAARAGLLELPAAVAALRVTNFRYPAAFFDALLEEHRGISEGEPADGG